MPITIDIYADYDCLEHNLPIFFFLFHKFNIISYFVRLVSFPY